MPQYLPLPDGSYLKLQEGESPTAALRRAQQKYPEAFAAAKPAAAGPQSGGLAALKAGMEGLSGAGSALMGKLGLKDMAQAEAEVAAAQKRAAEIFKPTEEGWTQAPGTKFAELLGGSAPYMALPLAAGAAALALPASVAAAPVLGGLATLGTVAGLGAAGLASAGQFTGTGLVRQMEGEEGSVPKKALAETSLPAAVGAAIPSAVLDTLSMRMIPGIGRIFGQAGVKVTAENAKEIAEQGLKKTLADYALKTGKTAGVEGATEAAQQVLERLQAGLSITNEKARAEYFDSFLGGAILGGTLAPAGRFIERGGEQREARGLLEKQSQEERKAAADAEKAKRESPDYILGVAQEYDALLKQQADLQAKIAKGSKEAPLSQEDKDRNIIVQQQLAALAPTLKDAKKTYIAAGGPDAVKKARESTLELTPPPGRVSEPPAVTEVPGEEEAPEAKFARAEQESQGLAALLEQQRTQITEATTPEEMLTLAQRAQKTEAALADAQKILAARPQQPDIANLEAELAKAQEAGDTANVIKYAQQLIAARAAAPAAESGLFAPEAIAAEEARRQPAIEAARVQPPSMPPQQEALLAEGEAEQAAQATEQQRELADAQFRAAQQTTLFPESQQRVVRSVTGPATRPTVTTETSGLPPERAQVETRPLPKREQRVASLLEQVGSAPKADTETRTLAARVQEQLPAVLQQLKRQSQEEAAQTRERLAGTSLAGRTVQMAAQLDPLPTVYAWAQNARIGTPSPDLTRKLTTALQTLEQEQRADTAAQTELEMPESAAMAAQARAVPPPAPPVVLKETQVEREARDAEARKAEQARLERAEAGPREQISFEGGIRYQGKADDNYVKLVEAAYNPKLNTEQRLAAAEKADEYLAKKEAALAAEAERRPAAVAKKEADITATETRIEALQDKLAKVGLSTREKAKTKNDPAKQEELLAGKRQKIEDAIKVDQDKLANHKRLLGIAQGYPKVTRTDPADIRAYREKLSAEIQRGFEPGKRLGVEAGTQKRGIGPVARAEVMPPRTLRTGSAESVAGVTTTKQKTPLSEARGVKQRDIPMTAAEKAQVEKDAARIREEKAAKEAGTEAPKTATTLEKIAKVRARINEINAQLAYIKANPSQTKAGQDKQATVKSAVTMERETLATTLGGLYKQQSAIETEAKKEVKEEAVEATKKKPGRKAKAVDEMLNEEEDLDTFVPEILDGEREDVFLSRGATENPSTTANVRTELGKVFPDLGRVQIFGSVDALVAANPEYEGKIPSDARGFVDPDTNKAFLIAENIEQGQALGVLLHEVGTHIGLKNMLGDAQYNALVKAVEAWEKRNDGSVESRVAREARERVEAASTKAGQVNDELLAYAVEGAANAGVSPTATKSPLGQWLARIAQAFRKALEKFGLPPKALDAQGLVDMAFGAAKLQLRNPKISEFDKEAVFQTREEMQTGVKADTALRNAVRNYLLGAGERPQAPQKIYRGVPKKQIRSATGTFSFVLDEDARVGGGTYVHYTPWFSVAKNAGKFPGAPGSIVVVAEDSAGKEQRYYRGGALAGDPLESTQIDSTKGMTWEQALAAAKQLTNKLYREEIADYSETYGLPSEEQRTRALEDAAERASDAFVIATYETDVNDLGGVWRKRDVPETLSRETPELRDSRTTPSEILFSRNLPTAARVANSLIGKEKGWLTKLRENFLGMGGRTQFVDKLAPYEEALKKGGVPTTKALQAMYLLRMYDQRMHFTSQAITEGTPEVVAKARKDGDTEYLIETKQGANIKQVVDTLKQKDVIKAAGSADAANKLFTLYLAAIRAERVGAQTLNFGGKVTEADLKAARAEIENNPVLNNAFSKARDIYNQYNRNLLEFSVQTGALSRTVVNKLLADNDYIPFYRMQDGVAQLIIGGETPIRIGNLKDSPHLKELVGGDEAIFDFLTSSVQNTAMLLDMSMKNLATKNAMFELRDVGLATVTKAPKSGKTPEGAVTFKRDGEDYFAIVDTDTIGIDSDLLVKGMAGIPTMFPSFVRVLGIPARILRRAVVASPVYMARQLFRDSLAASITSGANIVPVLGALRQIGKPSSLQSRGITGGQVFTGMPEDVTRMLKDMQAGKIGVTSGLAWLEAKSAQADALTREAQYQSYLDQGLSEMEATFMALESMNFSKRGLSPTMHMASTLIPFFNAQIQGLDVLYKAFTGKMPMNERLAIREKLWTRGMLMAGMSIAYAMAMQDEKDYKNARPEEKYGNWFVRVPGFDEMVRLPIPFEIGYVFKALPEAIVNTFSNDKGGEEAMKAAKHFATQMVPGLSNYFLPQAVKPGLEVLLNKSIYTERDIESTKEQMVEPGQRYRDNTTAAAREIGEFLNISPVKMEYLIRGYTGGMGMALLAALSAPFGSEGPDAPTKRMSDMPVIGTMFQPKDASGIIDATFARMKEVRMVKETYDSLIEKGRIEDAQKYLSTRMNEMALSSVEGSFREYMGQIAEYERGIKASSMTPDEKREKLDAAKQMKIKLAEAVRGAADKKAPQAAPA